MAEKRAEILRAARPILLRDGLGGTTLDRAKGLADELRAFTSALIAQLLESDGVPANKTRQVAAEVVAMVLGDAYQRAVLGIVEEGDSEAFAQQIAAAIAYAQSWRA
jgi:hypothetical protein